MIQCIVQKASTTLNLDLCLDFMEGVVSISHFTTILPISEGISVEKSKLT